MILSRWLATSLVLVFTALALPGCGGDDERSTSADGGSSPTTTDGVAVDEAQEDRAADGESKKKNPNAKERKTKDSSAEEGAKPRGGRRSPRALEKVFARLPDSKRLTLLRSALRPLLKNAGIAGSAVTVSRDYKTVTITVKRAKACKATTTDPGLFLDAVRDVLPFVRNVVVVVEGGQPLAEYLEAHCDQPQLPGGSGQVLFEQSGYGVVETEAFRIPSKRFTVEWAHRGTFFSVYPEKLPKKKKQGGFVVSPRPDSGKNTFTNGPGKFRLRVSGSGDWTVRVRSG